MPNPAPWFSRIWWNYKWSSQCGIEIASDDELLGLASRSGCRGLFIGFESLSQQNLDAWNKRVNRAKQYLQVVAKLHQAGIAVFAGFVFGSDGDRPDVFRATLEFLVQANVEALQATRLTPMPGTPLFDEMDGEGRISDKDWSHYDFGHVVFEPLHMRRETLDQGVAWVSSQFYSWKHVWRRLWKAVGYLGAPLVMRAALPLNVGYRARFAANGTLERGRTFIFQRERRMEFDA